MNFQRTYDVVVAGAGVAGVAAALESARSGLRTALVEKTVQTGGLATTGIVNIYLPLCDGQGTQVTFGVAEELLHLSYKYGPGDVPPDWQEVVDGKAKSRYRVTFSPAACVLAFDEVLEEAGVDLWLDTLVCSALVSGDAVEGVEVENKSGRGVLRAACVVDATGDADVAFRAGARCSERGNGLSLWALEASLEAAREAVAKNDGTPLLCRATLGADNAGRRQPGSMPLLYGTRGKDVTAFVIESRKILLRRYQEDHAQGGEHNRQNFFALTLPTMAQFRTTRRIEGQACMTDGGYGTRKEDSVGLVADWRKPGYVWEVPYGVILPKKAKRVVAAGRCLSSDGDAWEVMRVIPPAALTGQICGIAAVEAIRRDTTPDALDPALIQAQLDAKGIPYHMDQVGL